MKQKELNEILERHRHWINKDCDGWKEMRAYLTGAYLTGADLTGAYLTGADLTGAYLRGAYLTGADLRGAYLRGADLREAYLTGADLTGAYLTGADLTGAYLRGADLTGAYLRGAYLTGAYLRGAYLRGAYLTGADLREADLTGARIAWSLACPSHGSFIAWKNARKDQNTPTQQVIIKLLIPDDARRSSATTSKCRCDKAKVLEITNIDGTEHYETAYSYHARDFVYKVGEMVKADDFCEDRFNECAEGIHFYVDREMASNIEVDI